MVNDDPEYQWIDKIRTPRASNEARDTHFCLHVIVYYRVIRSGSEFLTY